MRCAWLNSGGSVWEREWSLFPVFRRLEVRLDVIVLCCDEWIEDVDFWVALVVST